LSATEAMLIAAGGTAAEPRGSLAHPRGDRLLLHADLHNHTRLSDGEGWAEDAFASMRAAGLDVAAVTDHTYGICAPEKTIDEEDWHKLGKLADEADDPGRFVAVRGFEWSSPSLGHMNVWGGRSWTEPLPLIADGVPAHLAIKAAGPPEAPAAIAEFHRWLRADPDTTGSGGGADALIGFNHPGRETGRFGFFRYDRELAERTVALEMFNRDEDYLFERVDGGGVSPLVQCLDAGWRVGVVGVTDEHRPGWGFHKGLGRTGLWSLARDRESVREAMLRRRMFATREPSLRVDATLRRLGPAGDSFGPAGGSLGSASDSLGPAGGSPGSAGGQLGSAGAGARRAREAQVVAMGARIPMPDAPTEVEFLLSFEAGPEWTGRELHLQVLMSGTPLPVVVAEQGFTVIPGAPVRLRTRLGRAGGDWAVLRVSDPAERPDPRAEPFGAYRSTGRTIAYLSPFFLAPAMNAPAPSASASNVAAPSASASNVAAPSASASNVAAPSASASNVAAPSASASNVAAPSVSAAGD
jgi:hypothetical protein